MVDNYAHPQINTRPKEGIIETSIMMTSSSFFLLQTATVIQMLMTASEHISTGLDSRKHGRLCLGDAQTLVRVLCHKKDREASKFLKRQYQLPMSSGYFFIPQLDYPETQCFNLVLVPKRY